MPVNIQKWVGEYRSENPNEALPYDDNGTRKTDGYEFASISACFQQRGYLRRDEFREIAEWKTARGKSLYKDNTSNEVEFATNTAIAGRPSVKDQVDALTELDGVGTAVASAILAVVFPDDYGVLDYRAWRAAQWFDRNGVSFNGYGDYSKFLDEYDNYGSVKSYETYLGLIQSMASTHGVTAREVDMALWAYDLKN